MGNKQRTCSIQIKSQEMKDDRKIHQIITAELPYHEGQLPQTDTLQVSVEAWVWGEVLVVAVDSCRPGYLPQKWVPTQKCRILVLLSELLVSVELQDRREESAKRGSSPETAY